MKDIRLIPEDSGEVSFTVEGTSDDTGLLLLQRLYVLLLTDTSEAYRGGEEGYSLLQFIYGGNIPSAGVLDAMLAISCASALKLLDPEDRELITSFKGESINGEVICTLELTDGTTIKGKI